MFISIKCSITQGLRSQVHSCFLFSGNACEFHFSRNIHEVTFEVRTQRALMKNNVCNLYRYIVIDGEIMAWYGMVWHHHWHTHWHGMASVRHGMVQHGDCDITDIAWHICMVWHVYGGNNMVSLVCGNSGV